MKIEKKRIREKEDYYDTWEGEFFRWVIQIRGRCKADKGLFPFSWLEELQVWFIGKGVELL